MTIGSTNESSDIDLLIIADTDKKILNELIAGLKKYRREVIQ